MRKILYAFIILTMLLGCVQKPLVDNENIKIIVASDIHYFLKDYYKDCEWFEENMLYGDGKMVTYADEILDVFIQTIKEIKPNLVILTGDLSFNGEKGSHEALAKKLSVLKDDHIDVAVIPGNHDVDYIYAKGYGKEDYFDVDNVNAEEFRAIYKNLGYQYQKHDDSLSYRIELNKHYSLLMMDSTAHELTGSGLDIGGYFTDSTMKWLKDQLKDIQENNKIPIIAMHHNLVNHNELLGGRYTIKDSEKIAELFHSYKVPLVLRGHIHCQNIKEINGIYDIASSSILNAPLQYGVIELNNQKMNYHTESLKISRDANEYFDLVSSTHFAEDFERVKDTKIRELMKAVIVKANRYYFTGNMKEHKDEIMNMEGYKYYFQKEVEKISFYKDYLESLLSDEGNHQQLSIEFE